jgi:predicted double-glycine peptidase
MLPEVAQSGSSGEGIMIHCTQEHILLGSQCRVGNLLPVSVALIVGMTTFLCATTGADTLESWQSCCGATCLRTVGGLLGSQAELAEIREWLQPNNRGETSLAEIGATAKKMGFHAVGLRIKSERLPECSVPLIAHRPPQHFVVLLGLGKGNGVLIVDPPHDPRRVATRELMAHEYWNVVAISKQPLSTEGQRAGPSPDRVTAKEEVPVEYAGLRFDTTIWNFGSVKPGDEKTYEFSFTNVSRKPITLSGIKANCSCLKIVHFTEVVAPGEQGAIRVLMDTAGMQGYVTKRIFARVGNSGNQAGEGFVLSILGEVSRRGELLLRPSEICVPDLVRGSKVSKSVILRRIGYEPLLLREIRSSSPAVSAGIAEGPQGSSSEAHLEIQVEAPGKLGSFEHAVVFETDVPANPTATLRIHGNVVPHITVEPPEVFLGLVSHDDHQNRVATIRSKTDTPFTIKGAEVITGDLTVTCQPAGGSRTHWKMVLIPSQLPEKGIIEGKVLLKTDDSDLPEIEIPYMGLVAAR